MTTFHPIEFCPDCGALMHVHSHRRGRKQITTGTCKICHTAYQLFYLPPSRQPLIGRQPPAVAQK